MNHWLVVPIVLPALAATALLIFARNDLSRQRFVGVATVIALLTTSLVLVARAAEGPSSYAIGNWPAPYGIVLVLDRLSAMMLALTSCIALAAIVYGINGWDARGKHFHVLFQFQLVGINGAFLTGDIFNLFVFFEVMLISSYGLMLHGDGAWRLKAGFQYVVLNLVGSSLFLMAVGLIYAATGTLNLAHLAERVKVIDPDDIALLRTGALLLFGVFAIKSAIVPLHWWLPGTYGAASAPVAALFAVLTKVGAYSILRLHTVAFSGDAAGVSTSLGAVLVPASAATLVLGALGVLASRSLLELASYSVIASMGTLLLAGAGLEPRQITAALYYMLHSTLIGAALFLLVDVAATGRGRAGDRLTPARTIPNASMIGPLFLLTAVASVGLPPLSGFIGKLAILDSLRATGMGTLAWIVILASSLLMMAGFARAGITVFWAASNEPASPAGVLPERSATVPTVVVFMLVGLTAALSLASGGGMEMLEATAREMMAPSGYIDAVLSKSVSQVP
ncbi:MAG: monovalent cation/H+ antiporter subunit D [Hyphomicrobiaceae bacterium]